LKIKVFNFFNKYFSTFEYLKSVSEIFSSQIQVKFTWRCVNANMQNYYWFFFIYLGYLWVIYSKVVCIDCICLALYCPRTQVFWTHDPVTFFIYMKVLTKGFSKAHISSCFSDQVNSYMFKINLYLRGTDVYVETWVGSLKCFFK
jgi:hypothetical protein